MIIATIITISVISGYLYRLGGSNVNTRPLLLKWKPRDAGCSLCAVGSMLLLNHSAPWWIYLIAFGITWGMLSTYWDELFGYDNYWFHGFTIGLAFLPIAIMTKGWVFLATRSFALAILMGLWCLYNHKLEFLHKPKGPWGEDETEEFGRGFVIPITVLFYLI